MCLTNCGSPDSLVCADCLRLELEPIRQKLAHVHKLLPTLRVACREAYRQGEQAQRDGVKLEQLNLESSRLESKLRELCGVVSRERVACASERRRLMERSEAVMKGEALLARRRAELEAVRRALFGGSGSRRKQLLESSPWRRAADAFSAFPIKRVSDAAPVRDSHGLRGVMAIVGLPLPNLGSAVLSSSALPRNVCRTALAAVASLVASVASALRVELPHPLQPRLGSNDNAAVDERLRPATRRRYPLAPPEPGAPAKDHDAFATALHLLQNDVTHVCVKAGLPPNELWPAEAILLNLLQLRDRANAELSRAAAPYEVQPSPLALETPMIPDDQDDHEPSPSTSPNHQLDNDIEDWIYLAATNNKLPMFQFPSNDQPCSPSHR